MTLCYCMATNTFYKDVHLKSDIPQNLKRPIFNRVLEMYVIVEYRYIHRMQTKFMDVGYMYLEYFNVFDKKCPVGFPKVQYHYIKKKKMKKS